MKTSEEIVVTEKDVIDALDIFTRVPALLLSRWVSKKKNLVKTFEEPINEYKDQLRSEDMQKLNKILEMPVSDLQLILEKAYHQTHKKQLKILSQPQALSFIKINLIELKKLLDH